MPGISGTALRTGIYQGITARFNAPGDMRPGWVRGSAEVESDLVEWNSVI